MMRHEDAVFGGEHSGHFYFRDIWYADSGMAALLLALQAVSEANQPLSAVIAPLDHRYRSGEINSEVEDVAAVMRSIEERYRADGAEIDHLDGVTVSFPTWWFNVRASNTQPLLRLNVEVDDQELLEKKIAEVLAMIRGGSPKSD
jgi:phosphomannomutase